MAIIVFSKDTNMVEYMAIFYVKKNTHKQEKITALQAAT
jgi:hypothetical protein